MRAERVTLPRIALGIPTAIGIAWAVLAAGFVQHLLLNRNGLFWGHGAPVGHDFHIFYTAATAAAAGRLDALFVPAELRAMAQEVMGRSFDAIGFWLYPPTFLLIVAPFALLPYAAAYVAFITLTLAAYLAAAWRLGLHWNWIVLVALAPTTLGTAVAGQNGFLTAALLVPGIMLLRANPVVAGLLLGVLAFKPHFGPLVLVALVADRAWRAAAVATLTALLLAALATALYGIEAWTLLFTRALPAMSADADVAAAWAALTAATLPHAARLLGPGAFAWLLQAATALLAAVATWRVFRTSADPSERALVVAVGTLLAFPYLFLYDLPMVTLALALYVQTRVIRDAEKPLLWLLAFAPLVVLFAPPLMAPAVFVAALVQVWRRAARRTPQARTH